MSTDRSGNPGNRQIIDEAAAWFVEMNEGEPDRDSRERFDAWLRRSPEHARAYLRTLPVWEEGAQLAAGGKDDASALISWAREGNNVFSLEPARASVESAERRHERAQRPHLRARAWVMAASIATLGVSVALGAWWFLDHRFLYETGTGEQRVIALSDGSRVQLNSRSAVRVRFGEHERDIDLLTGQALFRVVRESARPFVVRSAEVTVRAVGTEFDVYRKTSGTVVTVVEGRVAVTPDSGSDVMPKTRELTASSTPAVLLSAGEQAVVVPKARPKAVPANVGAAIAWAHQRLEFSGTPLTEVAEEFNRYNDRQLVIRGAALRDFHVTGTFSSSDPSALVDFLRAQSGVKVSESSAEIVVSAQ